MRLAIMVACTLALAVPLAAQDATTSKAPPKTSLAGSVVKEPGGEALKKAIVELIAENQEEGGNYTATSDQEGQFKIEGIQPGRYRMFVERPGYLEVDKKRRRSEGVVLSFAPGQELKDQTLHMTPAAIILGRVLDEDGDPMPNVDVTVLRRRASSFEPSGSAQTNDLGEFRIGGLLAGKYYVAATPMPNFQSLVPLQRSSDDPAAPPADMAYVTTFYPSTTDRVHASAIELHAGEEMPVNFSLAREHTVRIRGSVAGLSPGARVVVTLRGKDSSALFNAAEVDRDGKFEILHVAPGFYTITTMTVLADTPQSVRQTVEVAGANIDDLRLVPQAAATIRGRVHFGGRSPQPGTAPLIVSLHGIEGEDDFSSGVTFNGDETSGSPNFAKVKPDGSFELKNVPPGVYELGVSSDSQLLADTFVESLVAGTKDVIDTGLNVSGGTLSVDLTVSSGAGVIDGTVSADKNASVANAIVLIVPEAQYRKQPYRYQKVSADQAGQFAVHDLRPGNYTLYAWEVLDGDDYLNPDFLKTVEGLGTAVKVEKSAHQKVALKVIPAPADQP
jgi:Carboxypeptidase regulatory-like domain